MVVYLRCTLTYRWEAAHDINVHLRGKVRTERQLGFDLISTSTLIFISDFRLKLVYFLSKSPQANISTMDAVFDACVINLC